MAVRYAVAKGSWSNVATWDGGVSLPTVGDDVYANGFTIYIDQDIEVKKISTEVCPTTSVGGGGFYTIKSGDFYLIGNIVAGLSGCLDYGKSVSSSPTSRLYLIGNVYGGTLSNAYGIYLSSTVYNVVPAQQPIIIGNLYGGSGALASAIASRTDRQYTLVLTGNIYAGTGAIGVNIMSNGTYVSRITGNVYANGTYEGFNSNCVLYFTGVAYPSTTRYAISITTGVLYISGTIVNNNGILGINYIYTCKVYIQTGGSLSWQFDVEDGSTMTLYSNNVVGFPSESDVRDGTTYGPISEFEGTCAVPPPESVVKNVPVDDTVGTYALSGDLITRLEKCATTEEVDDDINNAKIEIITEMSNIDIDLTNIATKEDINNIDFSQASGNKGSKRIID